VSYVRAVAHAATASRVVCARAHYMQRLLSCTCVRYKHVHKVHHKSKNPGPWSGLSM